ncbi:MULTISPECIES: hypothetical protein [unclassified Enterococcus]|uniref:Rgg family transcriptional regulator n=1 Tax=unclassified Enterococcus TaxID=2608891 RepID=UPI001CE229F9|nr:MULTISPECIES: hypothetical protein [unclassified Enterococcus]MCA5014036.1 hypothetical protein [Enterococcus sp. S23]MCA5017190.1 hypothetical protein [Enterococcus sp. S22(2020)]
MSKSESSIFHRVWKEVEGISKEDIEIIYNELSNVKYFFGFEYKLLSNTITFFSTDQVTHLIQKAYPIDNERKRDYTTKKFAYNTLINLISITLHRKEYNLTRKYINIAKDLDKTNSNYSFRMNLKYLENLTNWIETGEPKYMQQITNFITILEDIGDLEHAKNVKDEVKNLTHHKDIDSKAPYSVGLLKES